MRKCEVCKKESRQRICETCLEFFKWKYGDNCWKQLKEFYKLNPGGKNED